jgi:hypothetical protein
MVCFSVWVRRMACVVFMIFEGTKVNRYFLKIVDLNFSPSASPIAERDHRNGFEILSIKFCVKKALQRNNSNFECYLLVFIFFLSDNANALFTVLSADQKAVKVWEVEPLQANKKLVSIIFCLT